MTQAESTPGGRVTTLELFFDLVFVFTLTQFTGLLADDLSWETVGHVAVMLALIYWMYSGYAWLTNIVDSGESRIRVLLLGGMASYLVIALAVPTAFDGSGLAFGIGWLIVNLIHSFLFIGSERGVSFKGLAPYNLACAVAVAVGGALGGDAQVLIWTAAAVIQWTAGALISTPVDIDAAHFVERHGLVVIVAIGESIVAMGIGAEGLPVDAKLVLTAVLGLLISTGMWFAYFGRDDDIAAEHAMHAAPPDRRSVMALNGFGFAHYALLLGIILAAVGVKKTLGHPDDPLKTAYALCVTTGVSLFLLADVAFRRILGLGRAAVRTLAAVVVFAALPAATEVSASAGLLVVVAVLAVTFFTERQLGMSERQRAHPPTPSR